MKAYLGMTPLEVAERDGLNEIAAILWEKGVHSSHVNSGSN